jgi:protein SCO1/2
MAAGAAATLSAQTPLQSAAIVEHVGAALPADLVFTDAAGRQVSIGSFTGSKPLVISLAYFSCPMLCPFGQEGAADAFRDSGWQLGRDFRALTDTIDPRDTPATAMDWHDRMAGRLHADPSTLDWHFVVGRESDVRRLAATLGFEYAYDRQSGQYSHPAALFVVTSSGRVSHYLYGITYDGSALAAALADARDNRGRGSVVRVLVRCFHYVPSLRQHGSFVVWLLRIGGAGVTASLGGLLLVLWRRERLSGRSR